MEKAVKLTAPKEAAEFFDKLLKDKAERKKEVRRKFNNGELKLAT